MLRIIHTGRAYEVLDLFPPTFSGLRELRDKYTALQARYWQQGTELEKACREIGDLKELLVDTEQKLRATELKLKSCQKSTQV